MNHCPFVLEVMGLRPGRGWIPALALDSDKPADVKAEAKAQGMAHLLTNRVWRVVRWEDSGWSR